MAKRNNLAWRTELSLEDCLRRLHEETDIRKRTIFSLSGYKGSNPVLSRFDGNTFRLWRRRYYRNDFAPYFFGTLSKEDRGTYVEGRFGMDPLVSIFLWIWLGFVAIVSLPIFVASLRETGSGDRMVGIWVPPAMIAFGLLLPKVGKLLAKGQERYLREFLESTLAARRDETGFSLSATTIENRPL